MSLPDRLTRRMDRPGVPADPYFGGMIPGYSQPSAIDSTGYSISDPMADSGLPKDYSVEVQPVFGGALDDLPGAASCHGRLGFGPGAMEMQHANRGTPIEYSQDHVEAPWTEGYAVSPYVGDVYNGGGWPDDPPGTFQPMARSQRPVVMRQELSHVDDYGDSRDPVDSLGRGSPGRLRNVTRGEYGD